MNDHTINSLLATKSGPCLSVIVPTYTLSRDRMQNPEILRKALRKSKSALQRKSYAETEKEAMIHHLEEVAKQFDSVHATEGLGLFISPTRAELVSFPFPVKEKIIIDNTFETRDLLYLKQLMTPYFALVLTKNTIRLFSAEGDHFMEINDGHFPMTYEEEYEYEKASLGTSFGYARKGFEKDKGDMSKTRLATFMHDAGLHLDSYLTKSGAPLLVAGTKAHLGELMAQPALAKRVSAKVIGSFSDKNLHDLRRKSWISMTKFRKQAINQTITDFQEKNTMDHLARGIQEVWQAAHEGKGQLLLVEKDYRCPSYLRDGDPVLHLHPPKGKYTVVPDAVDEVLETVIEKGGKVLFTEEKQLGELDYITLMLRYQ